MFVRLQPNDLNWIPGPAAPGTTAVSDLDPLASTVEVRTRTAGRWPVRGLVSTTRSIVPSSGSRCPDPKSTFHGSASTYGLFNIVLALESAAGALLAAMGFVNLAFQAMANASVQLTVDPRLRGRVMGLYTLAFIGGTPIGAPIIGVLTNHFGARIGMAVCGVVPAFGVIVMAVAMAGRAARRR